MPPVKEGDTITLHYKGSLDDGTVFDSSEGRGPLSFKVGDGQVIQGFDDGVRGMEVGESRQITTVRIIDVEGDDVTLDANHLLAGEALHFDVLLVSIDNE